MPSSPSVCLSDIAPRLARARDQWNEWWMTPLDEQLGYKPSFGEEFAHSLGFRVGDEQFQAAMAEAVYEVTGEEWDY